MMVFAILNWFFSNVKVNFLNCSSTAFIILIENVLRHMIVIFIDLNLDVWLLHLEFGQELPHLLDR